MTEIIADNLSELDKEIGTERERISTDRMDISFGEIINLHKNGELNIRPEFQRLYRWKSEQKTALIESILLGFPIPPIFVAEDISGNWELVDGLQRITTVISFFGDLKKNIENSSIEEEEEDIEDDDEKIELINKWTLEAGNLIKSLKGFTVDTLPKKYILNIKRSVCRVEILRGGSIPNMKYELFKRLNSSGSKLTPQEMRNAIYRGINPQLNLLLAKLSLNPDFRRLTNLSLQKRKELYGQELILKFFAFYNNDIEQINDNTANFLDHFMETTVANSDFQYEHNENLFLKTLRLVVDLKDDTIFKTKGNFFIPAEFEGIMVGVAKNISIYENNLELLRTKINQLKGDNEFKRLSGTASNSKSRAKNRLKRANEIFGKITS
jgi:uncharacterized protein with ParB-like and HNH nuclease domain